MKLPVPLTVPLVAVTVPLVTAVLGAVTGPAVLIVPAEVVQAYVGAVNATPNWSVPAAANCCVPPAARLAVAGVTAIEVNV